MLLINVRHNWPERPGMPIRHQNSGAEYVCLHFYDQVQLSYDQKTITASPGSFIVFSPNKTMSYQSAQPYRLDKMYIIGNVPEIMLLYGLKPNTLYHPTNNQEITDIMEKLEFEFYQKHNWAYRYMDIKIEELFMVINANLPSEKRLSMAIELQHRMQFIRQEMMAFPERDWSVKNWASRLNVSESRLYPLYRSLFGISPNRDLILARIERSKMLLEQGYSPTEAAEKSGYHNIYHFIRQFQKETHFTPYQYVLHCLRPKSM